MTLKRSLAKPLQEIPSHTTLDENRLSHGQSQTRFCFESRTHFLVQTQALRSNSYACHKHGDQGHVLHSPQPEQIPQNHRPQ